MRCSRRTYSSNPRAHGRYTVTFASRPHVPRPIVRTKTCRKRAETRRKIREAIAARVAAIVHGYPFAFVGSVRAGVRVPDARAYELSASATFSAVVRAPRAPDRNRPAKFRRARVSLAGHRLRRARARHRRARSPIHDRRATHTLV